MQNYGKIMHKYAKIIYGGKYANQAKKASICRKYSLSRGILFFVFNNYISIKFISNQKFYFFLTLSFAKYLVSRKDTSSGYCEFRFNPIKDRVLVLADRKQFY
ncbi:hypothetical protein BpHYR1_033127 [Brachionus plicatilis]|uniref:Uncharacterized protein n=1 Tax=Brachionus plicatilis TaxID=10195 RepID=A0A3M7PV72_BRAPC|nr:hypothetical protein BpHYR1_033127 [Brachionus plicatilis]